MEEEPELCDSSDDEDNSLEEQRKMRPSAIREAILEHYSGWRPYCDVTHPDGSVAGSSPGTDDCMLLAAEHDQDAHGRESSQPKPNQDISAISKGHPGPRMTTKDIKSRDSNGSTSPRASCPRRYQEQTG